MAELADVSPERYTPLVAPVIERLTFAVLQHAIAHAAQMPQTVSPKALRMLGQLRTALMARPVSADGLAAVYRYRDAAEIEQDLQGLIAAGLVDRSSDGAVTATEGGRVVLGAMYDGLAAAASRLWATQAARLTRLSEMAGRVVDAAVSSGGDAYATVAPPFEPPDADTALLVHTRVSVLRYHRADAHAAAWRSAGLTSATVAQLPPGSGRDAIEADTNHGAGVPYLSLTPDERLIFLGDLAAPAG